MKNIKEVMVSLMAIAACALPSYGSAEGVTNQISNCVNAHGEEMAAAARRITVVHTILSPILQSGVFRN